MKIRIKCTCGKAFVIDAEKKGRRFRCPSCGEPLAADSDPAEAKSESPGKSEPSRRKRSKVRNGRSKKEETGSFDVPLNSGRSGRSGGAKMMTATERKNAAVDALDELDEAIIAIHSDWNQLPPGAVGTQGIESVPAAVGYHFTFPWQLASGAWNAVELRQPFGPTYFGGLRGNVAAIVAAICIGGLAIGLAVFSGPRPGGNGGLNGPGLLLFCMVLVFPCLGMAIAFAVQGSVMKNLRAGIRGVRIEIRHDDLGRSGGYRRTRTTAREVSLHRHERIRAVRIAWYQCSIQWWMFHFIACSFLFGVAATILRLAFSVDKS